MNKYKIKITKDIEVTEYNPVTDSIEDFNREQVVSELSIILDDEKLKEILKTIVS